MKKISFLFFMILFLPSFCFAQFATTHPFSTWVSVTGDTMSGDLGLENLILNADSSANRVIITFKNTAGVRQTIAFDKDTARFEISTDTRIWDYLLVGNWSDPNPINGFPVAFCASAHNPSPDSSTLGGQFWNLVTGAPTTSLTQLGGASEVYGNDLSATSIMPWGGLEGSVIFGIMADTVTVVGSCAGLIGNVKVTFSPDSIILNNAYGIWGQAPQTPGPGAGATIINAMSGYFDKSTVGDNNYSVYAAGLIYGVERITSADALVCESDSLIMATNTNSYILLSNGTCFRPIDMTGVVDIDGATGATDIVPQNVNGDDIDSTSEDFVFNDGFRITSATDDSMFMTKGYIDAVAGGLVNQSVKGDHVDSTSEDFVFNDAFRITSATEDSMLMSKKYIDDVAGSLTEEEVEDFVGGMLGGTETGITVTYEDASNDIDFVVDSEPWDSLTAWANLVNEAKDSLTSWANEVNAATDSLASWANEVNAATDTVADWTGLLNEAKDSLTSWANEVNAATDSLTSWANEVNAATDSLASWANEINAATDSLADWTSLINEAKDSLTAWANKVNDILPLTKSFVIQAPDTDHDFPFWMTPVGITLIACNGVCIAGTNVVGCLMEYDNDAANPVVCNSSDWTFTTGEERTTDLSNASIDAGDYLGWKTTSVSGEVSFLTITIEYTQP